MVLLCRHLPAKQKSQNSLGSLRLCVNINMRKSTLYISLTILCSGILGFLLVGYPLIGAERHEDALQETTQLVAKLGLTDLCLFTEARYTRHLSQTDLFSAFQDHPMSFEHFPSGSLTLPPVPLVGGTGK